MEAQVQVNSDGNVQQHQQPSSSHQPTQIIFQVGTDPTDPTSTTTSTTQASQLEQEHQEKLRQLQQKLAEKDLQRQQVRKEREQDKDKDPDEDYNLIQDKFNKQIDEVISQLEAWKDLGGDKELMEKHFAKQFEQQKELREYIANYAYSVPAFVLQQCQTQLDQLHDRITEQKELAFPKKKFTFARKQQPAKSTKKEDEKQSSTINTQTSQSIVNNSLGNHLLIKDVFNQEIRKTAQEYSGKENVIIESLENCTVYLPFAIKSLYIKNIKDCKIFVGAVSGASFVNAAINCEIYLCSHQIRIHNSERTKFFLIAKSNPIIEHCKDMLFGLYKCTYEGHEQDLKESQLWEVKNFWNQILDFNWLRQDKSPNWNIIAEDDECYKDTIKLD